MILYVETNFILELAYQQELAQQCEELLILAESGAIALVVPAFCLIESRMSRETRASKRKAFYEALSKEVSEVARTKLYATLRQTHEDVMAAFVKSNEQDQIGLEAVLDRTEKAAVVVPFEIGTNQTARKFEQDFGLSPQDSAVLASVLEHLGQAGTGKKIFLNKNKHDFADPKIQKQLADLGCDFHSSFKTGLYKIRAALGLDHAGQSVPGTQAPKP
jgi:hypothetical protein